MTAKKPSPLLTKDPILSPTGKIPKKLFVIALLLVLIAIAYFVWPHSRPTADIPVPEEQTVATSEQIEVDSTAADANTVDSQMPDSVSILNAPLPETDSLAKEEIDRLEDEHQRLEEQEKLATEQVQMNKELTDMKAEQIKLLEQQIAALEAAQAAQ